MGNPEQAGRRDASLWAVGTDCFACAKHARGDAVRGGVLYRDDLVYAGHALPLGAEMAYRGYLVVEPTRHVPGLGDLTDDEAAAVGRLVNRAARALKKVAGAEHVYSFVIGHSVPHLHVLVAPRYPGTPREFWGMRLTEWPDRPVVDDVEMRPLVSALRDHVIHS